MSIHAKNKPKKVTVSSIKEKKNNEMITMITAYDTLFSKLFDGNIDIILVGDSLNMSFNGKPDTLSATMEIMLYHTKAVCKGAESSLIVLDMPFGSYMTEEMALENAKRVYQESDAAAVKIEGGKNKAHIIKALTSNSIAVMGHIGLMPQYVRIEGGYKVKGKDEANITKLVEDAKAVEEAGAFAIIIEGVKLDAAREITKAVSIPTIGIGAGADTDGQVLVWSDMLGLFEAFKPKFVKQYLNGAELVRNAVAQYAKEVKTKKFPTDEYSY